MPTVAIIGGSGLSQLGNMEATQRRVARTPYGEPSGALTFGRIKGRSVLVLDDILDHGKTMNVIRNRLLELGATEFCSAVLVEKKLAMKKPIKADFVGLTIPDRFVFGCGMDAKGYWRNLPEIRAMKE